jgi:fructose transport system ATP-binding protein
LTKLRGVVEVAHNAVEEPLLQVNGIRKSFGRVAALNGVDFDLQRNEVVALVGDNGAGKSTLVKMLSGILQPDDGSISLNGRVVHLASPADARQNGIETVYQDLALAGPLDIESNMFLGRERRKPGLLGRLTRRLDVRSMRDDTERRLAELKIFAAPTQLVETLSGGQRQAVAIARAVSWGSRIVILDEPTAALGVQQAALVIGLIRQIRSSGRSVILISHNLPDVFAVADRIQVLRLGQRVGIATPEQHSMDEVVGMITGANVNLGQT